jgi:uncharacterized protein YecE (DUF72 family)
VDIQPLPEGFSLSWKNDARIVPYSVCLDVRRPSGGLHHLAVEIRQRCSESPHPFVQNLAAQILGITVLSIGKEPRAALLWQGPPPFSFTSPAELYVAAIKSSSDEYQALFDMATDLSPKPLLRKAIRQAQRERGIAQAADEEAERLKTGFEHAACMKYLRLIKEKKDREGYIAEIEKDREEHERTCENCHAIAERALHVLVLLEHALRRSYMSGAERISERERLKRKRSMYPQAS